MKWTTLSTRRKLYNYIKNTDHPEDLVSQAGEDKYLSKLFSQKIYDKDPGFYVDVGCYDPLIGSNTYYFWKRSWRGINIDASEDAINQFKHSRPEDVNLWIGVGYNEMEREFTGIDKFRSISSFSNVHLDSLVSPGTHRTSSFIPVRKLSKILDEYLPDGQEIDFLDIDVEGLDLEVLQSNNWDKYRPRIILIEIEAQDLTATLEHPIIHFLNERNYKAIHKCPIQDLICRGVGSVIFYDCYYGLENILNNKTPLMNKTS